MTTEQPVFDVSTAVAVLNQTLDYAFPTMTIVGELINFKVAKNRWVYADVADDESKLKLFGTVYNLPGPLEDGMMIEVVARPQIHPQYGFSLSVISMRPVGEGSIKKASDLLRLKLEKEGLFDPERKRTLPYPPQTIGLVTSVESAAYADFVKVLNARWQGVAVTVYNSPVQGEAAIESLIAGLQYFNQQPEPPDVIVMIRGGGSADDLSVFSAEQIVRSVAASRVPTMVAIGHENDISLAELAADVRGSTPSNAAELLFPEKNEVADRLHIKHDRLADLVSARLAAEEAKLTVATQRLSDAVHAAFDMRLQRLQHAKALLESVHPKATLRRGYALVQSSNGRLVSLTSQVQKADSLKVTLSDGSINVTVD